MARYEKHVFRAPGGIEFRIVLGRSTYSVAVHDRAGRRIEWSGRNWGPSLTDALMMACYRGEPSGAKAAIAYLFTRIDGYADSPGIRDLWRASEYIGRPQIQYSAIARGLSEIVKIGRDEWKARRAIIGIQCLAASLR